MKTKKCWILSFVSVAVIAIVWPVVQGAVTTTESTQKNKDIPELTSITQEGTLKGIKSIYVAVENLKPEAERHGLTKKSLQTDIELRLRKYGIKVVSEDQWMASSFQELLECGKLYLNVDVSLREEVGLFAYAISFELIQPVLLARSPKMLCWATTWEEGWLGTGGLDNFKSIRESVAEKVDNFINAYLAANPKEQPVPVEEKDKSPKGN